MSGLLLEAMVMLPQQVWEERGRHQGWEGSVVGEETTRDESRTGALRPELGRLKGPEAAKPPGQLDVNWAGPQVLGWEVNWLETPQESDGRYTDRKSGSDSQVLV